MVDERLDELNHHLLKLSAESSVWLLHPLALGIVGQYSYLNGSCYYWKGRYL